jgi:hypothetical protein
MGGTRTPTFSHLQQRKGGEGWEEKLRTATFRSKVTPMGTVAISIFNNVAILVLRACVYYSVDAAVN